jgi:hypothetical protein
MEFAAPLDVASLHSIISFQFSACRSGKLQATAANAGQAFQSNTAAVNLKSGL